MWMIGVIVAEANPIKQGLKLHSVSAHIASIIVAEANPIKQGLKLPTNATVFSRLESCRG